MTKLVRYNGGTQSYYGCTDPSALVYGKTYEVISVYESVWHTEYTLKDVDGQYNSAWFDDATDRTYMAYSNKIPELGEPYKCHVLDISKAGIGRQVCRTSRVERAVYLGNNVYQVYTRNSLYIVQVI